MSAGGSPVATRAGTAAAAGHGPVLQAPRADTETPELRSRLLAAIPVLAIVAVAFAAADVYAAGIHSFSVMPDELGYVKQALAIASSGHPLGPHAFYFNSWGQLLPVLSAPIFGLLSMPQAYALSHHVYSLLMASSAIPAYLLARELRLPRLAGYTVAALTAAVPWLAMSALVMTEVVAYPVFAWAVLGIVRAVSAPSPRRDVVALAGIALAFFARTQFVVLGLILLVATLLMPPPGYAPSGLRHRLQLAVRAHTILWVAAAVAIVGSLAIGATNTFGSYATPLQGQLFGKGALSDGFEQLSALVLGVGIVPFILGLPWTLASLREQREPARRAFAIVLALSVIVFTLMVGSFQSRFLWGNTTDRYLFYLAPLLFTAGVAWVFEPRGGRWGLVAGLAAGCALVLTGQLHTTAASIVNPSFAIQRVFVGQGQRLTEALGLGTPDPRLVLAAGALTFALIVKAINARQGAWATLAVMAVVLLAFVGVSTGYAMVKIRDEFVGISPSNPSAQGWIDKAVGDSADVATLISWRGAVVDSEWTWWDSSFWNKSVRRTVVMPGADTYAQGFVATLQADVATGDLSGLGEARYLVKLTSESRLGLRWPVVHRVGSFVILARTPGPALRYWTAGVDDSGLLDGRPVTVWAFPAAPARTVRVSVSLNLADPQVNCPCLVRLGHGAALRISVPAALRGPIVVGETVPGARSIALGLLVADRTGHLAGPWAHLLDVSTR